ncbi:MAG: hypothetical protein ACP5KW_12050, partial [Thermoproteota archaeon]
LGSSPSNYTYDASSKILTLYVPHTFVVVYQTSGALSQPSGGGGGITTPSTLVLDSTFISKRRVYVNSTIYEVYTFAAKNPLAAPVYSATVKIKGIFNLFLMNSTVLKFDTDASSNLTKVYVFGLKPYENIYIDAYLPYTLPSNPYSSLFSFLGFVITYGQLYALVIALVVSVAVAKLSARGFMPIVAFVLVYVLLSYFYFGVDPTFLAVPASPSTVTQTINATVSPPLKVAQKFQNDLLILLGLVVVAVILLKVRKKR